MNPQDYEKLTKLIRDYMNRWPDGFCPGWDFMFAPKTAIDLLEKALRRGSPITEGEFYRAFPGAWRPGDKRIF